MVAAASTALSCNFIAAISAAFDTSSLLAVLRLHAIVSPFKFLFHIREINEFILILISVHVQ